MKELQFSHITKTAGTSVEHFCKKKNIFWGMENKNFWLNLNSKSKTSIISGDEWHLPLSFLPDDCLDETLNKFDFFCIVRNPYERVISEYYCNYGSRFFIDKTKINLKEIKEFQKNLNFGLEKIKNSKFLKVSHWQKQHLYVFKNKKRIIKKENVIFYENLKESLNELFERYQLNLGDFDVHKTHGGVEKIFNIKSLSDENICLINEIYKNDFDFFGYEML